MRFTTPCSKGGCRRPMAAASRVFRAVQAAASSAAVPQQTISVMTYNILAQKYAQTGWHNYCPSKHLRWDSRKARLLEEIAEYSSDIVCLQEVESSVFTEELQPWMASQGYRGHYLARQYGENVQYPPEGVALFYRTDIFEPLQQRSVIFSSVPTQPPVQTALSSLDAEDAMEATSTLPASTTGAVTVVPINGAGASASAAAAGASNAVASQWELAPVLSESGSDCESDAEAGTGTATDAEELEEAGEPLRSVLSTSVAAAAATATGNAAAPSSSSVGSTRRTSSGSGAGSRSPRGRAARAAAEATALGDGTGASTSGRGASGGRGPSGGNNEFWSVFTRRQEGAILMLLRHRATKRAMLAAVTHLFWNPAFPDVKAFQASVLCQEMAAFLRQNGGTGPESVPVVLAGDFNSLSRKRIPDVFDPKIPRGPDGLVSGVYTLLTCGSLSPDHPDHPASRRRPGETSNPDFRDAELTSSGLKLASAYYLANGRDPPLTTRTATFAGCLDYIFVTPRHFDVTRTLELPYEGDSPQSYENIRDPMSVNFPPIPNEVYPSDHLSLVALLRFKD